MCTYVLEILYIQGGTDAQHQPIEYAVVDKSKKKIRKKDKQQNVSCS